MVFSRSLRWLLSPLPLAAGLLAVEPARTEPAADETAAIKLYEAKDPAAQAAFEAIAAREPNHAAAVFHLGALARQRGEFEQAVRLLERAVELAPDRATYQLELGFACGDSATGKNPVEGILLSRKSKACYDRALQLEPDNYTAHLVLMNFYRDMPAMLGGDAGKARQHALELCRIDPSRGLDALVELAIKTKDFARATADVEQFHREHPESRIALFQLGRLASLSGQDLDRGMAALQEYLHHAPAAGEPTLAQAHWRLGVLHHRQGHLEAARREYQAALDLDPASEQARASLASLE